MDFYVLMCDISYNKLYNKILNGLKSNLCNGIIWFNCKLWYYVSFKDVYVLNFISFKLKIIGIDMKKIFIKSILEENL